MDDKPKRDLSVALRALSGALVSIGMGTAELGHARADAPPVTARVMSAHSTSGSFGLVMTGASEADCIEHAKSVAFDNAATFDTLAVRPCEFAFVPTSAVPLGQRCISLNVAGVTLQNPCFEVTGQPASVASATLALERGPGSSTESASCYECSVRPSATSCTRLRRVGFWRVMLSNLPVETAASFAFALVPTRGPASAPVVPSAIDFSLWSEQFSGVTAMAEPDLTETSCVDVYARPFVSTDVLSLGRLCIERTAPATVPAPFNPIQRDCDPNYVSRWCADNAADCQAGGANACAQYSAICTSDAGRGPNGPDASVSDGGHDSSNTGAAGRDAEAAPSRPKSHQGGCGGCTMVRGRPSSWLFLLLVPWMVRRRVRSSPAPKQG